MHGHVLGFGGKCDGKSTLLYYCCLFVVERGRLFIASSYFLGSVLSLDSFGSW